MGLEFFSASTVFLSLTVFTRTAVLPPMGFTFKQLVLLPETWDMRHETSATVGC